jgi:glyceraldehyde 3-phosphate dehydrogenase
MPSTRVALTGFGRIGRNLFRILYRNSDVEVVAINEIADHASMEYLLRFDTILGRFPDELSIRDSNLYTVGREIPIFSDRDSEPMPWADLGVDVVVEATARNLSRAEIERHLEWGAKRVVLCSPSLDPPDATIVLGANDDDLKSEHRIISNSSCTAQAAVPVLKTLHEAFGIQRAFLSTVHAYTNQQRLADVPSKDKRRGRAAAQNIIPQQSDAAVVVENLVPELQGRITSASMNVPVSDGSVVDLVCWHDKKVSVTAINEVMRTAIASRWQEALDYETEPIVSSDILRSSYSGTFDSLATMALGENMSKTLTWFENGWGYAHRVVDLIHRLTRLDKESAS